MRLSGIARRPKGVAAASDTPLVDRVLVWSETTEIGSSELSAPFDLELADGHRVRVELAQKMKLEPSTTKDGKWSALEDEPYLATIRSQNAPGPHVKVRVTRSCLNEGDRVELLAEDDAEYVFEELEGHRAAPERRLNVITARTIATGDDATAIIDRLLAPPVKPPKQTRRQKPSIFGVQRRAFDAALVAIGGALVAFSLWLRLSPLSVDVGMFGVVFIVTALVGWTLERIPRFVRAGKMVGKIQNMRPGQFFVFMMGMPGMFIVMAMFFDHATPWQKATDRGELYNASWGSVIAVALWGIALAAGTIIHGRAEARLFRVLLRAPPLPPEGPLVRTWGSFEGIVRDPTPVTAEGEAVAIVHVVSEEVVSGSDPNIYTERVLSKGTFFVDPPGGSGRSIEVDPDKAVWASSVGLRVPRSNQKDGHNVIDYVRAVPLRGSILVAGRVDRKEHEVVGKVAATGAESLLFVAVREGQSARAECHAMLTLRRVGFLVAVASIAIAVGTIVLVEPQLPGFNLPGEGGD